MTFPVLLVALAVLWRPFAGRVGVVLGLAAAGVAFAMQEVIGALAGWASSLTGRQTILREEAQRTSSSEGAQQAITQMRRHYPVGRTEVQPRVFVRATDNWIELSARFVVPVREARVVKDAATRTVLDRLSAASIPVASTTQDVTVRPAGTAEDV